jgi:hypothetical protein
MTTNTKYHPRIFRFCLRLCVFVFGVVLILGSATPPPPPPRPTATLPPPPPRPGADIDETKPHSVVRLVTVTPPIPLSDQHVVTIDRHYQVKSQWLVSSWHTTRTSRYIPKGTILVANRNIQFGFGFSSLDLTSSDGSAISAPLGLSLVVRNESARGMTIDWNTVTLIDQAGTAHGVIHRGVKMADRSGVLAPSTIPPGAVLDDFVYPREVISFSGGRYGSGWTGVNFFEAMKPQQQFKLYLPLKHGAETVEYQFVFEIGAPEQRGTL